MRLSRTFLMILALLVACHAYIGWRILPDLPITPTWRWVGVVALMASCVLVPMGLAGRSVSHRSLADRLAWAGLLAMGLFSSLFMLTLLRDVLLLGTVFFVPASYVGLIIGVTAQLVVGLALFATLVGFVGARRNARVVTVDVPLQDLPKALHGFSIAQISDIHVGPTIKRRYLDAIVDRVNGLHADLIAVTGDLVDGSVQQLSAHTAPLARLVARHGTYFVTGNHEYYSGEPAWTSELRRLGLTVLKNEHVVVKHDGAELVVAGVTDFGAHHFDPGQRSDPAAAMLGAPTGAGVRILLAHQPRSAAAAAAAGFDLQLSGHTHGGQFWPWNLFVRFQQPFTAGLHRLQNLWVYTSRGTGYWGPPKRFGAPSEITRIRLVLAAL